MDARNVFEEQETSSEKRVARVKGKEQGIGASEGIKEKEGTRWGGGGRRNGRDVAKLQESPSCDVARLRRERLRAGDSGKNASRSVKAARRNSLEKCARAARVMLND